MHTLFTVFFKEFLDNLRDRRTLISALLFGPLFGPLMFGFMVSRMLEQSVIESDEPLAITVSGAEHAPGLIRFLEAQGSKLKKTALTEDAAREAVRRGSAQVVLVIPDDYGALFSAGSPAPVYVIADSADSRTRKVADRARRVLSGYTSMLAQLRLQARGINPVLAAPVAVNDIDVATPAGRAVVVLGFMTYFVLFALLMGGLYLAIDSTAGERERGSLEPLLTLPVKRAQLIFGKILAACAYMLLSLILTVTAFAILLRFAGLERLGMSINLGPAVAARLVLYCLPLVPLGAALMTIVAAYTRTYREAQSYLGLVLLVPTLPLVFAGVLGLRPTLPLMAIPSLSQHFLITSLLRDEPLPLSFVALACGASLAAGAVLVAIAGRLYRREALLG
jgi:sodium transport system permease protein